MRILFAIDLLDGKCVRLKKGDFGEVTVYGNDPLSIVEEMIHEGARDFHIVDLNGAREGEPKHVEIIKKIREKTGGYIQVGGGIRRREIVEMYTECGINGVIVGTRAYTDPEFLASLRGCKGIILSVDIREGKPMIMGWQKEVQTDLKTVIRLAEEGEVSALLVTAVERDGTMTGPDFEIFEKIMSMTQIPVIASGGVTTVEEIQLLKDMGVEGVVLGKAIYEKKIHIKDVLKFY